MRVEIVGAIEQRLDRREEVLRGPVDVPYAGETPFETPAIRPLGKTAVTPA